jgi:hypothetical protein
MHHVMMTTLNDRAMRGEVSDSRLLMTSYGLDVSSFAYPFSEANDSVVRAVSKEYMAARLTGGTLMTILDTIRSCQEREAHFESDVIGWRFSDYYRHIDATIVRQE